ncbi:DUF1178 family protein [Thalassovita sp.]|jgi:hypothetical protein|uniref:DUF1178 family protein n=1 Tax=Thalassovita sp. TaxID=1979401 RepID=UPI003B5B8316
MIQFTLKCDKDHRFDSWFQSGAAFDKLKAAGMVTCSICGSAQVEKAIMAPRVRPARMAAPAPPPEAPVDLPAPASLSEPQNAAEEALGKLRRNIEENSEYVGDKFTQEARAMHEGDSPERAIYGEAKLDDAKQLIEDGIPVLPLPFMPGRKTN